MLSEPGFGATRLFVAVLTAGSVVVSSGQSLETLDTLTVPAVALPAGCAAAPTPAEPASIPRDSRRVFLMRPPPVFPTNPWSGTDRALVAAVRGRIDASPMARPDGQMLNGRAAAEFDLGLADNVREAYHATYSSSEADGDVVDVFAVTFDDEKLAGSESVAAMLRERRGISSRFVRGATVVVVSAPAPGECVSAVEAHVRSLE